MSVSEEPVCICLSQQNPVFTSLHLRSAVHVVPTLIGHSLKWRCCPLVGSMSILTKTSFDPLWCRYKVPNNKIPNYKIPNAQCS
jgi:hypothetical protein